MTGRQASRLSSRKALRLLLRYYLHALAGPLWRTLSFSFLLFLITAVLFVLVLGKTFVAGPHDFHLAGQILVRQPVTTGPAVLTPAAGALVEVGGFRATCDSQGNYSLDFQSPARSEIPVLVQFGNHQAVERVSFPLWQGRHRMDLVIP